MATLDASDCVDQIIDALPAASITAAQKTSRFKQFDIVADHSDHFYTYSNMSAGKKGDCFKNAGSNVYKKIMQEWRILENNLPESIFVRVYEGRIDLLRAVIIGAQGTPYHDGLFFFDFAFPSDYPNNPPLVHYHSHGLELNPNLYDNGYVCLSLLNTWSAEETEMWNPTGSTVLQALVSLQALVLNEKPYYNEPGYEEPSSGDWDLDSAEYNGEVFGLSCKTMMFLIDNPPKNFEAFVKDHFCERANVILAACRAYIEGRARVGYYDGSPSSPCTVDVSREFKGTMEALYPNLEVAFNRNAASKSA
uniref:Uncharacterized protein MANES_15G000600 n=2 Tax=Rhizophora mucronata TaxID=61149 RepID=A0A2P2ILQ0_RHIMU